MKANILSMFNKLNESYRVEVVCKLGIEQTMSKDSLEFIKYYLKSSNFTDPLSPSLLQLTVWDGNTPISIFRESSAAYNKKDPKSLHAFLVSTSVFINYKTCNNAKR